MQEIPGFVLGVVVGIALSLLVGWARKGSVTDLDAATPSRTTVGPAPVAVPNSDSGGIDAVLAAEIERAVEGRPAEGHFELGHEGSPVHITGVVHRMAVKIDQKAKSISITSDGRTYGHLAEIPDDKLRAEARRVLTSIAGSNKAPEARAIAAAELESDGAAEPPGPAEA